jgi:hypothetical protein
LNTAGRRLVESEIGLGRLAEDCARLALTFRPGPSPWQSWESLATVDQPESIRRLRPNTVDVSKEEVNVALMGGFEHYGYKLTRQPGPVWRLEWYTDDLSEPLLTIPHKATD